jgi:hypothetical protein
LRGLAWRRKALYKAFGIFRRFTNLHKAFRQPNSGNNAIANTASSDRLSLPIEVADFKQSKLKNHSSRSDLK